MLRRHPTKSRPVSLLSRVSPPLSVLVPHAFPPIYSHGAASNSGCLPLHPSNFFLHRQHGFDPFITAVALQSAEMLAQCRFWRFSSRSTSSSSSVACAMWSQRSSPWPTPAVSQGSLPFPAACVACPCLIYPSPRANTAGQLAWPHPKITSVGKHFRHTRRFAISLLTCSLNHASTFFCINRWWTAEVCW